MGKKIKVDINNKTDHFVLNRLGFLTKIFINPDNKLQYVILDEKQMTRFQNYKKAFLRAI